ncbi:hypothetical protein [Pseudogemmobacter blasticus]|uniref:4Fe-4S ferredoxin-type domain-containing protein n=1 Tax=Fuscovulum blasticum DSM 2131 TaxID=1188250 RepID=A0A2T4JCC0_FUSBL|nr:hypothetical protein [Fuscovulum blasticum]PTE15541.1 hypothetical protein C5F44_03960 [Fuscovulum blasticum DSM 2131]
MKARTQGQKRQGMAWVLLVPFLLMSLISPAVMPARADDGTLTLVLCTGDGPVEMTIDLATGAPAKKAPDGSPDRCAWACAQCAGACPGGCAGAALPHLALRRADPPPATTTLARAEATGLPPATGPPSAV